MSKLAGKIETIGQILQNTTAFIKTKGYKHIKNIYDFTRKTVKQIAVLSKAERLAAILDLLNIPDNIKAIRDARNPNHPIAQIGIKSFPNFSANSPFNDTLVTGYGILIKVVPALGRGAFWSIAVNIIRADAIYSNHRAIGGKLKTAFK